MNAIAKVLGVESDKDWGAIAERAVTAFEKLANAAEKLAEAHSER